MIYQAKRNICYTHLVAYLASLAQSGEHLLHSSERSSVQIPAMYSRWHGHYNNVGCSVRLEISFELNPVTEGK